MERTCQYRLLTAGASLAAGTLAILGALAFLLLDAGASASFAAVWGFVFASSLTGTFVGTLLRGREVGERLDAADAHGPLGPDAVAGGGRGADGVLLRPRRSSVAARRVDVVLRPRALATSAYAPTDPLAGHRHARAGRR